MAKSAARTVLTVAAVFVPSPVSAQARQPYSIQGSALDTVQDLGTSGSVGGAGAEIQFRYTRASFRLAWDSNTVITNPATKS